MNNLAIITAFPGELKPLVEGWQPLDLLRFGAGRRGQAAWRGRISAVECVAVSAGMGKDAVARACTIAQSASGDLDGLVSLGWAGALSSGVHAAQAYVVAEVIDGDSGQRFLSSFSPAAASRIEPAAASGIQLVTIGHVALAEEKRQLAERYGAVLVDMEGAAVARIAREKGIDFYCFKAVSDAWDEVLPDFSRYGDGEGQIRMPALLAHTAFRPKYWPAMARMGKNTKKGAVALAAALRDFLEQNSLEHHADDTEH
jgi:adenosylhomocysteine nucleosidase